jgi:hypothetical protein
MVSNDLVFVGDADIVICAEKSCRNSCRLLLTIVYALDT